MKYVLGDKTRNANLRTLSSFVRLGINVRLPNTIKYR